MKFVRFNGISSATRWWKSSSIPKDLNLRKRISNGASLRSEVNNDPTGLQSTLKNPINIVSHTGAA